METSGLWSSFHSSLTGIIVRGPGTPQKQTSGEQDSVDEVTTSHQVDLTQQFTELDLLIE